MLSEPLTSLLPVDLFVFHIKCLPASTMMSIDYVLQQLTEQDKADNYNDDVVAGDKHVYISCFYSRDPNFSFIVIETETA
jgi:hypothetical protein